MKKKNLGLFILSLTVIIPALFAFKSFSHEEQMNASTFKTYKGLETFFAQDFDYDAKCSIQSYELIYQSKNQDTNVIRNKGADFNPAIMKAVLQAKPGDTYVFRDIRTKCGGDTVARLIPGLVVMIR